jgi:hypothetical protein
VPRRVSLPTADDLFRTTGEQQAEAAASKGRVRAVPDAPEPSTDDQDAGSGRRPSGRVRHDEKMTVYVTSDELLDLEHTRLALRRAHGIAVDRGRLVREAVALVLADFEEQGETSALVRRLREA